jgi:hypothetical protein
MHQWRRVVMAVSNRAALLAAYQSHGISGAIALPAAVTAEPGQAVELELVNTEDRMIFHVRGHVVADPAGGKLLHISPSDRKTRDIILAYARGESSKTLSRRARRFPLRLPIEFTDDVSFEGATTGDINFEGAFVEFDRLPSLGTLVALRLFLEHSGGPLSLRGEVVRWRQEGRRGFAVRFMTADKAAMDRLGQLLLEAWAKRDER